MPPLVRAAQAPPKIREKARDEPSDETREHRIARGAAGGGCVMFEGEAGRKDAIPLLGQARGENDRQRRDEDHADEQCCKEPHDEPAGA